MRKVIALTTTAVLTLWPVLSSGQSALIDGQVIKVDVSAGKITINHGPIEKYDMNGHTMIFRVQKPDILKIVKAGDKIKFDSEKINGKFTVTKIEKAK